MNNSSTHRKLLHKIARAYYQDRLTYEQIGARFGFSRMKVARLLRQAEDEKIVQVVIAPFQDEQVDLERRLETRYGLYEAVVIKPPAYDPVSVNRALGLAAVDSLMRCLTGKEVLAVTWGRALVALANALPPRNWSGLRIVQLIGGLGNFEADTYSPDLVRQIAQNFGARPYLITAPGVVRNESTCRALMAEEQVRGMLSLAASADLCLTSIGRLSPQSYLVKGGILSAEEYAQLLEAGAVGDIALRFFNARGEQVAHEIHNRVVGLDLEQIKRIPRVIGIAGEQEKTTVIRAALRGQFIKVLITDDRTAASLLAEPDEG